MHRRILSAMALAVAALVACPALAQANWVPVSPAVSTLSAAGVTYNVQTARKPWSLLRDLSSNSFRMECRSGDEWAADAGRIPARDRAELGSQQKLVEGVPYTVTVSIETGGVPRASKQTIVAQEHASDDAGGKVVSWPIWALEFSQANGFRITASASPQTPLVAPIGRTLYQSWKWSNGVPHLVKIRFINDHGEGRGAIAAWIDGVKVVDQVNVPLGYAMSRGPYVKLGCYRVRAADKVTVTYRDLVGPVAN